MASGAQQTRLPVPVPAPHVCWGGKVISCKQLPTLKEKLITNWLPFELDEGQEAKLPGLVRLRFWGPNPIGLCGVQDTPHCSELCLLVLQGSRSLFLCFLP